ncbi:hypothetical protein [Enterococcus villorum]|uniref:Uncharacterized protein n=1 Tax=Enterococcus villorum TaxID=112904 RepID=A0A511J440_9ENTE|nr:hypothetical protein EVI01_20990 [Enterococcus villorum]
MIDSLHRQYQTEVINLYDLFKKEFLKYFELDYHSLSEDNKELFNATAFSIHYKTIVFPEINFNPIVKDEDFYCLYPNLIKKIKSFCNKMAEITKNKHFLNNHFLIKKYALLYELFYPLAHLEKKINIYFETNYPYLTDYSLKKKIEKFFSLNFNITIYSAASLNQNFDSPFLELKNFDLIITTSTTTIFKNAFKDSSVIYIQYQNGFSEYDFHTIYSKLKQLVMNQSTLENNNSF